MLRISALITAAALLLLFAGAAPSSAQVATPLDSSLAEGYRYYDQPINPDLYLVRPGERLTVTFVNTNLPSVVLSVDPEGRIVQRNLGILQVSGKTLTEVRRQLRDPLTRLYNVDEIDVSVGEPYVVSISLQGAAQTPGVYRGYSSQRVSEILLKAGGVQAGGSTRHIVFAGGNVTRPVDLDRVMFLGDDSRNPRLYAGSRIFVPDRSDSVVNIIGEVNQPRVIELMDGDDIDTLVLLAGGPTRAADLSNMFILGDSLRDLHAPGSLRAGDVIVVPAIQGESLSGTLVVFGAVPRPGRFAYREGLTLGGALELAGGISSRANIYRITVFRRPVEDQWSRVSDARFPIAAHMDGKSGASALPLLPGDSVFVPQVLGFVKVSGQVRSPGLFPYTAGEEAAYYVGMAGGFSATADKTQINLLDRVSGLSYASPVDVVVGDGDEVIVNTAEKTQ